MASSGEDHLGDEALSDALALGTELQREVQAFYCRNEVWLEIRESSAAPKPLRRAPAARKQASYRHRLQGMELQPTLGEVDPPPAAEMQQPPLTDSP